MVSLSDGKIAVVLSRDAVSAHLEGREVLRLAKGLPPVFAEVRGVFVTIKSFPSKRLRGCIGFPRAFCPLGEGVVQAAVLAATEDPRFSNVGVRELSSLLFEVSVLSKPEEVRTKTPLERINEIKVGRDGLIVEFGGYSGLLLPQVPVELSWGEEEFLNQTCVKAGLPADAWRSARLKLFKFSAQVFCEEKPNGEVVEEKLA